MPGTIKMVCIRMNILSHRNNIVLFLACNMAAMQNLYIRVYKMSFLIKDNDVTSGTRVNFPDILGHCRCHYLLLVIYMYCHQSDTLFS